MPSPVPGRFSPAAGAEPWRTTVARLCLLPLLVLIFLSRSAPPGPCLPLRTSGTRRARCTHRPALRLPGPSSALSRRTGSVSQGDISHTAPLLNACLCSVERVRNPSPLWYNLNELPDFFAVQAEGRACLSNSGGGCEECECELRRTDETLKS